MLLIRILTCKVLPGLQCPPPPMQLTQYYIAIYTLVLLLYFINNPTNTMSINLNSRNLISQY